MKKLLLFLVLIYSISFGENITWTDVTSNYNLPNGVKLFKGTRTSPILQAYYFDVDLNNPNIAIRPYLATSAATVKVLNAQFGAYASVNGGFFGGSTSYSAVIYPNEVKAQNVGSLTRNGLTYPVMRGFFGMKNNRELSVDWIYHFNNTMAGIYKYDNPLNYIYNDPNPKPAPTQSTGIVYDSLLVGIGGGPVLVKNGQVHVTYNEEIMWGSGVGLDNGDPRTAIGYTANKHVLIMVVDGRQSTISTGIGLTALAQEFITLGCVEALNLDGGGSTQMAVGNQFVNSPSEQRAVPVIFAITHSDSLHLPKEPTFEKIIDTGDPEASLNGPDWFPTANTGFYGTTAAQLNAVGTGESYAQFNLNLTKEASYQVYGWWVASSNRCKNTPFIIEHKDGIDTVRADQSTSGSTWKLIGTYTFAGTSNENVKISDAGTGSNVYVVADAIRLVSYDSVFVSVDETVSTPVDFNLSQNYPNPFNPSTTINYSIADQQFVNLTIYNIVGEKVKELVNQEQNTGNYSVNFNAEGLSSGTYFYTLRAGNIITTKKMTLLK